MQRLRRLTFYVEPVVFRQNPNFLYPWLGWIARIVHAHINDSEVSFSVASSPWLCRALEDLVGPISAFPINPVDVLRPFNMDRVRYGQDLARSRGSVVENEALRFNLQAMVGSLQPDAILSFTQNRYLADLSQSACVLFTEMQPLPRSIGTGFFIDPSGHQADSLLVTAASRIRSLTLPVAMEEAAEKALDEKFAVLEGGHPETAEMMAWFLREADSAPIALLALQPPDWITFEGLSEGIAIEDLLLRWLDALPAGWRAVATYHPSYKLPRCLEESIAEQMPNLLLLPEAWKQGRSEWLLQAVDALVTVSSAVGWSALLAGKRVIAPGRSNLTAFAASRLEDIDDVAPLSLADRCRLATFLTSRYCTPEALFLDETGYLALKISNIMKQGEDYFFEI